MGACSRRFVISIHDTILLKYVEYKKSKLLPLVDEEAFEKLTAKSASAPASSRILTISLESCRSKVGTRVRYNLNTYKILSCSRKGESGKENMSRLKWKRIDGSPTLEYNLCFVAQNLRWGIFKNKKGGTQLFNLNLGIEKNRNGDF